jgi:hypothetical protein
MIGLESVVTARGCKRKGRSIVTVSQINIAFKSKALKFEDVKRWLDLPSPPTNKQKAASMLINAIGDNDMSDGDYNEFMFALKYTEIPPSAHSIEVYLRHKIKKFTDDHPLAIRDVELELFTNAYVADNISYDLNRAWGDFTRREDQDAALTKLQGYTALFESNGDTIRVNIHERRMRAAYRGTWTNSYYPNDTHDCVLNFMNDAGFARVSTSNVMSRIMYNRFAVTKKMQMYNQVIDECTCHVGSNVAKIIADYNEEPVRTPSTDSSIAMQVFKFTVPQ